MNKKQSKLFKIVLFLFALNSLTLYLYFSSHHHNNDHNSQSTSTEYHSSSTSNHLSPTEYRHRYNNSSNTNNNDFFLKPWPILPSYLPWTQNPNKVKFRSCEAYFGNGFTRRVNVLSSSAGGGGGGGGGGWFKCFYSKTLRSSVCEGGSVRMVPERIKMSRGGEKIEEVIGRGEEEELPEFENGAFDVLGFPKSKSKSKSLVDDGFLDAYVPNGDITRHTMRALIGSIRVVNYKEFQCDQVRNAFSSNACFYDLDYAVNFS